MKRTPLPGAGLHLSDAFREEETKTRCPGCRAMAPTDPSKGGMGICIVCHGRSGRDGVTIVTRENTDGTYETIICPGCGGTGRCTVCKGSGMVSATQASAHRRAAINAALRR